MEFIFCNYKPEFETSYMYYFKNWIWKEILNEIADYLEVLEI